MRLAKIVFLDGWVGACWCTRLYFMFDTAGRQDPPAITHPSSSTALRASRRPGWLHFFVIA
jgi:hypothetical protein